MATIAHSGQLSLLAELTDSSLSFPSRDPGLGNHCPKSAISLLLPPDNGLCVGVSHVRLVVPAKFLCDWYFSSHWKPEVSMSLFACASAHRCTAKDPVTSAVLVLPAVSHVVCLCLERNDSELWVHLLLLDLNCHWKIKQWLPFSQGLILSRAAGKRKGIHLAFCGFWICWFTESVRLGLWAFCAPGVHL